MQKVIDWLRNEPVRVYIYGIVGVVVGFLLMTGEIDATSAEFYMGAGATVLAVERVRAKVSPVSKTQDK